MAAQGFLLIAEFLLILLVLAKPLFGHGKAHRRRSVAGRGWRERILLANLGITDHDMNGVVFTGY